MALDWPNERYVRLYQRETPDQAVWCWQALAIWPWLLVKADRAGVIQTRKRLRGLAGITKMPLEVVEAGMVDLIEDGCIRETTTGYFIPNYIEAQTAVSTGAKRTAEYKARERAAEARASCEVADVEVTRGDAEVIDGDEPPRAVTACDAEVTPNRSEPNRSEISLPLARGEGRGQVAELVAVAYDRLNAARSRIDATSKPLPLFSERPLVDRLLGTPETRRAQDLEHCLGVLIAEAERSSSVNDLHFGYLGGPKAWPALLAKTVASVRGRDGPGGRRGAIGRAAPSADHSSTDRIDPKDIAP